MLNVWVLLAAFSDICISENALQAMSTEVLQISQNLQQMSANSLKFAALTLIK